MRNDHFINDIYFALWRFKTALLGINNPPIEHKHLFIMSGAACGSTLLHEIISESKNVAIVTNRWAREGMRLPVIRDIIKFKSDYSWKNQPDFDWPKIQREFLKYWSPRKEVFLDKGPIYLFQANSIDKEFKQAHFICLHRNPYSQIESYMRKSTMDKNDCISYAVDTLLQQREYLENLNSTFSLSYTQLTENPAQVLNDLSEWMPELGIITLKKAYAAHNVLNEKMGIKNLDHQKIDQLSDDDIQLINRSLEKHEALMAYFGYEYVYR